MIMFTQGKEYWGRKASEYPLSTVFCITAIHGSILYLRWAEECSGVDVSEETEPHKNYLSQRYEMLLPFVLFL